MRPLPSLYKILLKYFEDNKDYAYFTSHGICHFIDTCPELTGFETTYLKKDFQANRPSSVLHTEHMDRNRHWTSFWWDLDTEGNEQRVKFLKHMIKYHENKQTSELQA